jgi:formamidopyrimidine-DNA glycosylase
MPELPEVETTRRGISPHLIGRRLSTVVVRQRQLRWPVPEGLEDRLVGRRVDAIARRAKYLLLD